MQQILRKLVDDASKFLNEKITKTVFQHISTILKELKQKMLAVSRDWRSGGSSYYK
jgi:hypothetical protein